MLISFLRGNYVCGGRLISSELRARAAGGPWLLATSQVRAPISMDLKQEILDAPRALRETLEKGRPEYEALVRRTRWGDGPVYLVGSGTSYISALAGGYAFEGLLAWPAVVRPAADFATYSISVIGPRSVVLAIPSCGELDETLDAARVAKSRGACLLALADDLASPLAKMADGVFLIRAREGGTSSTKTALCRHAALCYIALVAARVLKRRHPQLDVLEEEFQQLPGRVEWVLTQLQDAVRSFAAELQGARNLCVVGGGFYHPTALQGALLFKELAGMPAEGFEPSGFRNGQLESLTRETAVVLLSGSRCGAKRRVHELLGGIKKAGAKVYAVTDANDRELSARVELAVLLPSLGEIVGSTLALSLVQWLAFQVALARGGSPDRAAVPRKSPGEG